MGNIKEHLFLIGYLVGICMGFILLSFFTLPEWISGILLMIFGVFMNNRINKEIKEGYLP